MGVLFCICANPMFHSAEFRMYGRLFTKALPEEQDPNEPDSTWRNSINPKSLEVRASAKKNVFSKRGFIV